MTAKEQADKLIELFLYPQRKFDQPAIYGVAKECAFLSVQHTIEVLTEYGRDSDQLQNMDRDMAFWYDVMKEILES